MERDDYVLTTPEEFTDFNSHAHVERDVVNELKVTIVYISTHTLTWSVTVKGFKKNSGVIISTHTLTWSVTNSHKQ